MKPISEQLHKDVAQWFTSERIDALNAAKSSSYSKAEWMNVVFEQSSGSRFKAWMIIRELAHLIGEELHSTWAKPEE